MKQFMVTVAVVFMLSACSGLSTAPPVSFDGLRLQPNSSLSGTVYVREGVDLTAYNTFTLDACTVAFRKNWQRDQNSSSRAVTDNVSDADMNKIRVTLATLCDEQFSAVLSEEPAYTVVSGDAVDTATLLLKPSIINLDIAAPDIQSSVRSQSYTAEAGEMTLFLEVVDASSGEILYRVIDRRREHNTGQLQWTNSVTNMSDARRTLSYWGKSLRRALDQVAAQKTAQ